MGVIERDAAQQRKSEDVRAAQEKVQDFLNEVQSIGHVAGHPYPVHSKRAEMSVRQPEPKSLRLE